MGQLPPELFPATDARGQDKGAGMARTRTPLHPTHPSWCKASYTSSPTAAQTGQWPESDDQPVWGLHSELSASMTSGLLPDWLGCEWWVRGARQGHGQSAKWPSSALPWFTCNSGGTRALQLLQTALANSSHLNRTQMAKIIQEKQSFSQFSLSPSQRRAGNLLKS